MPTTTYKDWIINYNDADELRTLLEEVFKQRIYYAELTTDTPLIVDAGAHIGLSTLYFHSLYPQAKIIAIEPNPQNLALLRKNIADNSIDHVHIYEKALIGKKPHEELYVDEHWTVFSSLQEGGWTGAQTYKSIPIQTLRFRNFLAGFPLLLDGEIRTRIDLLKMDIEGMEIEVLEDSADQLTLVKHFILEFHETRKNKVDTMVKLLKKYYWHVDVTKDHRKEKNPQNQLYMIEAHN
ncbi:hypothetical protein C5B42_05960 [Candidatus Cerribacteria bacterium 'Amazon FNV 2010 28 9']|uniref:Methyltransferase FkbM domain-containing protein n=1 Tax=Candidatus Cerribacteria bacterium 'Amazon FNV 2010 28 9' TaxID=2081795 RepID=A0A317JMB3_9BACT|nr:MAG: hypothetical protein C5B42_05960 [Candidatus Cerribacteria bacterium 'Amazon FNV 2010 28 9']